MDIKQKNQEIKKGTHALMKFEQTGILRSTRNKNNNEMRTHGKRFATWLVSNQNSISLAMLDYVVHGTCTRKRGKN